MTSLARESSHRNYMYVFLTTFYIAVSFVACMQEMCFQNRCMEGVGDVITTGISRKSCLDECRSRDWCVGVSYHVPTQFCMVHDSSATDRNVTECEGFCYSEKAKWQESTIMCEDAECDQNRATCVAGQPCRYQDCPIPKQSNGLLVLLGNLRSVGTKVAYMCSGNYVLNGHKSLTCLSGGSWSGAFPTCRTASPATTTATSVSTASVSASTTIPAGMPQVSSPYPAATTKTTTTAATSQTPTTTTQSTATTTIIIPTTTTTAATSPTPPTTTTKPKTTTTPTTTTIPTTNTTHSTTQSTTPIIPTSTTQTTTPTPPTTTTFTTTPTTTSTALTTNPPTMLACTPTWTKFQASCYYFHTGAGAVSSLTSAQMLCGRESAFVVVPNTFDENEFIKSRFAGQDYWIDIEQVSADDWRFPLREYMYGMTPSYNGWASGVVFDPAIKCAKYDSNSGMKWRPQECSAPSQPYPYVVCEKPAVKQDI